MAEQQVDQRGTAVEESATWWRSRLVGWALGSVVVWFLVGALSSGLFPDSTFASLVTGITWSLAWLTLLVLLAGTVSWLWSRRH